MSVNDLERIEVLASKLSHELFEVKARSASNLLFKLHNKVILKDILRLPRCIKVISSGILSALRLAKEGTTGLDDKTYSDFLISLLKIISVVLNEGDISIDPSDFSSILDELNIISKTQDLVGDFRRVLDETISMICSIKTGTQLSSDDIQPNAFDNNVYIEQDVSLHPAMAPATYHPDLQSTMTRGRANAGAILHSKLATIGWQFPTLVLTELDEKFLFDVEVKLKLANGYDSRLLFDVLVDFPVSVIFRCKVLLEYVLDCIGAGLIMSSLDQAEALTPVDAMRWFDKLFQKALSAFKAQMEGSICSAVPKIYDGETNNETSSFTAQLAVSMYKMRAPLLPYADDCLLHPISNLSIVHERLPPSLPGLAFSICAAALPLLKVRNLAQCNAILDTFRVCLPYICEPNFSIIDLNKIEHTTIDVDRLTHLVRRLEQIVDHHKFKPYDHFNNDEDELIWSCDLIIASIAIDVLDLIPKLNKIEIKIGEQLQCLNVSVCSSSKLADMNCVLLPKARNLLSTICPSYAYDVERASMTVSTVQRLLTTAQDPWAVTNRATESLLNDLRQSLVIMESDLAINIDSILSAILVSLKALLVVDETIATEVGDIVTRLLISCGHTTRAACIEFLNVVNDHRLVCLLANPTVIGSIIFIEGAKIIKKPSILNILHTLFSAALDDNDYHELLVRLPYYASLLVPLKLLCWQTDIIQSYPKIEVFTDRLEDVCFQSTELKSEFFRALVTGLLHVDGNIRSAASVRLRSLLDLSNETANLTDPFSTRFTDKFYISSLGEISHSTKNIQVEKGMFELKDIRKLSEIALASDFDVTIRLSAIHQLLSIISSDPNLLRTIETSWSTRTATLILELLGLSLDGLVTISISADQFDLVNLSLALLAMLIRSIDHIREVIVFIEGYDGSKVNATILVRTFLSTIGRSNSFSAIRAKCGIILSLLVCDPMRWLSCEGMNYQTMADLDSTSYKVPSFLCEHLIGIGMCEVSVPLSGDEGIDVFRITFVPSEIALRSSVSSEQRHILSAMLGNMDTDYNIGMISEKLVTLLATVQSSIDLQTAVSRVSAALSQYANLGTFLLQANVADPLSKYLSVCPSSSKDMVTLSLVLDLLVLIINSTQAHGNSGFELLQLATIVIDSVNGPLASLLPSSKLEPSSKPKHNLQLSFYNLVQTLYSCSCLKDTMTGLMMESSLAVHLCIVASSEVSQSSLRHSAITTLEGLVRLSFISLRDERSISAPLTRKGGQRPSFDDILNIIKLLRTPDSLRGTAVLVVAMRITVHSLALGLCTVRNREWRFILRYMYDRRVEVRLLALEIVERILSEDESLVRTDEETTPDTLILRIAQDPSEAHAVRMKCAKIYVRFYTSPGACADDGIISQLLRGLLSTLDTTNAGCSSSSMAQASKQLCTLITSTLKSESESSVAFVTALKTYKVFQAVVNLLNPATSLRVAETALLRLNMNSETESSTYSFEVTSTYLIAEIERSYLNLPVGYVGYTGIWASYQVDAYKALLEAKLYASRALHALASLDDTLFSECIRNTNLIRNLVSCITKSYNFPIGSQAVSRLSVTMDMAYSASLDLLSLMLTRDKDKVMSGSSHGGIAALVLKDSMIPSSIISSVSKRLAAANLLSESSLSLANSSARLLCFMMDDTTWCTGLGLGGPYKGCPELGTNAMKILMSILAMRESVENENLLLAFDMTISIIAQNSYHAKLVLLGCELLPSIADNVKSLSNKFISSFNDFDVSSKNDENKRLSAQDKDKWRSSVRGYKKLPSPTLKQIVKPFTDACRKRLFSSLILLKSISSGCYEAQMSLKNLDLQGSLTKLLRMASAVSPKSKIENNADWIPSDYQLSALVLATSSSFAYMNPDAKRSLVNSGDPKVQMDKSVKTNGSSLHQLASLGLSTSISKAQRRLCLSLIASLVKDTGSEFKSVASTAQNSVLARTLGNALYQLLDKPHTNPDDVVYVLDALASCVCAGQTIFASGGIDPMRKTRILSSRTTGTYAAETLCGVDGDMELPAPRMLSLPEFISWVYAKHEHDDHVLAALIRLLGSIADCSSRGNRRVLVNVTGAESVQVLVKVLTARTSDEASVHDQVHATTLVALWSILHNSEQARAQVKTIVTDESLLGERNLKNETQYLATISNDYLFYDTTRARGALSVLLQ